MPSRFDRRGFLQTTLAATAGAALSQPAAAQPAAAKPGTLAGGEPWFRISLAEWSLHRTIRAGKMTNLDFPKVARQEFGIDAVEYVNQFFRDKARDASYLAELNRRCDGEGVRSLLIMIDGEGRLGDPDAGARTKAAENHHQWVDAAKTLGCHSIRVNAASAGAFEEQQMLAADGLAKLGEYAATRGINVLVENHGGLSSCGVWLAGVMRLVDMENVGTLPDFGNFYISRVGEVANWYDRYQGVAELMPFAKAVSAKSRKFDSAGNEAQTDFRRTMRIVHGAGYRGYVGIEWEGGEPGEFEGVRLTKRLLERIRSEKLATE